MSNSNEWLTKAEAAERLGVSVRSLERYAAQGRLVSGRRDTKHGKQVLFDAQSLDALKAELEARREESAIVLDEVKAATGLAIRRGEGMAPLVEALAEAFQKALTAQALPDGKKEGASVPIADKLTLSLREAAALAGHSRAYLLEAIHAGELQAAKRANKWNLKRSDLEAWVTKL